MIIFKSVMVILKEKSYFVHDHDNDELKIIVHGNWKV